MKIQKNTRNNLLETKKIKMVDNRVTYGPIVEENLNSISQFSPDSTVLPEFNSTSKPSTEKKVAIVSPQN